MSMRTVLAFLSALPLLSQASPALRRADSVLIHPDGDTSKCLGVSGPNNDAPTEILDCHNLRLGQYVRWEIAEGDNLSVQLAGTNLCLDAGTNPHNNGPAKVYQCYPGLIQQHWYYTADERIAITGGNQCLDQTNGNGAPQTYKCTTGNTNQIWSVSDAGPGPTTTLSSTTSSTPTTTTTSPTSTSTFTAPSNGTQLYFNGNTQQCLSVTNGYAAKGTTVALVSCFGATDPAIGFQLWTLTRNAQTQIVLTLPQHGKTYCLTYSKQQNGGTAYISPCDSNNPHQTFWYTEDNHVSLYNGNQCLDVVSGSGPRSQKPYGTLQDVQTWACSGTDKQQIWTSSIGL
ncbi:ricin B-like lectin [Punctularia strigosozonata HHB-11173 SS5]|uniref:ricin B-like lectin n=1 Tax=Punctularia strigosozonata (strain HHB-11173) TaxID=741275 RepID=UPI000441830E|nr:ricin B-like lectin [Punctularia strigosozonata HHB-11173 SS5]EIN08566.1 ricin B-like lectin [Punctularia strigosozonata HHB-11173 SS5]